MSEKKIIEAINSSLVLGVMFSIIGRKDKAQLFVSHAIRLIAAHMDICERWIAEHKTQDA